MTRRSFVPVVLLFCLLFTGTIQGQQQGQSIHQAQHRQYQDEQFQQDVPGLPRAQIPLAPSDKSMKSVFGYHPYWMGDIWQDYQFSLLTTIAYFGLDISSTGNITNTHGWPPATMINMAHSNGVRVVVTAILFNSTDISTLLSSAVNRQNLIDNLLATVQSAGADGVNIDFELVPGSQRSNFTTFMQDLAEIFHDEIPGSHVSAAVPAVDWSEAFNEDALAEACDALFIMGYDYHWSGSETTGPVSPLNNWGSSNITNTVNEYLANTGNDRNKLILGLPYYGYQWTAVSGDPGTQVVEFDNAYTYNQMEAMAVSFGKNRNVIGGQIPWYRRQQDTQWEQGWFDDSLSLALKYDFANQSGLQGVGIWALGYDGDRPKLWQALADYQQKEIPAIDTGSGLHIAAYPNPAHGNVTIRYTVPEDYNAQISLGIYDLQGQKIATYFEDQWVLSSGTVNWNGQNEAGEPVASGIYLIVGRDYFGTEVVKVTYLP